MADCSCIVLTCAFRSIDMNKINTSWLLLCTVDSSHISITYFYTDTYINIPFLYSHLHKYRPRTQVNFSIKQFNSSDSHYHFYSFCECFHIKVPRIINIMWVHTSLHIYLYTCILTFNIFIKVLKTFDYHVSLSLSFYS